MESWSNDEVCRWLVDLQMSEHVARFRQMQITGADLITVNEQQLGQTLLISDWGCNRKERKKKEKRKEEEKEEKRRREGSEEHVPTA
jgi:hypothetical protein